MNAIEKRCVTIVGSLPPNIGISDTCVEQVNKLSEYSSIDFIDFKSLYPNFLYPGETKDGSSYPTAHLPNVRIRKLLSWYNPFSWIWAGCSAKGKTIHIHWWTYVLFPIFFSIAFVGRIRRKYVVVSVHNIIGHESNWLDRILSRIIFQTADRLIVHSDRNKEALAALCPNSTQKIRVIPLATQESLINHLEKYTAREALSLPQGDKVIIYFGNIRPYKGVDILIKSFATIVTELPETTLVIAGKPWISWDPFEKMIESLGLSSKIKTKLYRITSKEISLLFSSADLLILPYMNFEAQSGPGRLALGYGLPMVVTDVGGLPELVGYSEQCIVPPGDDKRIAASALCILQDPLLSKTLGEFALAKSRSFQWADNIRETLSIYHF